MPLTGDYEPGTARWARDQADRYEASAGAQSGDLRGRPVIVLTSVGAKTGKLRKTALMRVEQDGVYAVVASLGGSPHNPRWYHNLKANPHVELQDGPIRLDYTAREVTGDEKAVWWEYFRLADLSARQVQSLHYTITILVLESPDGPSDYRPFIAIRVAGITCLLV
jgi:deazaflavin-dependent oxidoreductase (nitroreductase family)